MKSTLNCLVESVLYKRSSLSLLYTITTTGTFYLPSIESKEQYNMKNHFKVTDWKTLPCFPEDSVLNLKTVKSNLSLY